MLFRPSFVTHTLVTTPGILAWNGVTYDLYVVRASTGGEDKTIKDDRHAYDLGFQAHALGSLGVPLGQLLLMRLNRDYVRWGELELEQLFSREDFTERVEALLPEIASEVRAAHADLAQAVPLPGPCCCMHKGRSRHCPTFAYSNPDVPAYSIHDIARIGLSPKKLPRLINHGVLAVADVPDDFRLTTIQANQVAVAQSQQPLIDRTAIAGFLAGIRPPVAFLDYETFPAAVPRFEGYRPFDQIPFQFSLDVVEVGACKNGMLTHHEFLFTEPGNPDAAFIAALEQALPGAGSVVVWNKAFETGVNSRLADRSPTARALQDGLNARVVDLEDVFRQQMLVHPGFRGRTSLKMVLPALAPALSYKDLVIQEGAAASAAWNNLVTVRRDAATIDHVRRDLLTYCALDTHAMVEIWRVLRAIVGCWGGL